MDDSKAQKKDRAAATTVAMAGAAKDGEEVVLRSRVAKGVYNVLFAKQVATKNVHFQPGRMAYLVDLEDENAEMDVPTTVIRSKTDCPDQQRISRQSTNDIVINKLTQILSYLRAGTKEGKKRVRVGLCCGAGADAGAAVVVAAVDTALALAASLIMWSGNTLALALAFALAPLPPLLPLFCDLAASEKEGQDEKEASSHGSTHRPRVGVRHSGPPRLCV